MTATAPASADHAIPGQIVAFCGPIAGGKEIVLTLTADPDAEPLDRPHPAGRGHARNRLREILSGHNDLMQAADRDRQDRVATSLKIFGLNYGRSTLDEDVTIAVEMAV